MPFEPGPWLDHAEHAFEHWRKASRFQRRHLIEAWLSHYHSVMDDLAMMITGETGKPITLSKAEVQRGLSTLQATAEAIAAFGEECIPYDLMPGAEACRARLRRFPKGPALAITPFNFPVNLALHKLAPALGAGCSMIWKPCPQAPETSKLLLFSFEKARKEAGAPKHLLQIAQVAPEEAETLARDPRITVVSFTGSETVGLRLRQILCDKTLVLELGGNAAVVLDEGIDALAAAKQLAPSAVAGGGQNCCKAQRFYVHRNLWPAFMPAFLDSVKALTVGDPMNSSTVVGPLVNEAHAIRMDELIDGSLAMGAKVLLRGTRHGRLLPPCILTDVEDIDPLSCEECFSPVVVINPVDSFEEGLERAADTRFGLRTSAYSRDLGHLRMAEEMLRSGGVLLNLPPTFRLDSAPFGGLGHSGQGFEGPRWALEHYTEARLIVEGPPI